MLNFKTWAESKEGGKKFPVEENFSDKVDEYLENTTTGRAEVADFYVSTYKGRVYFTFVKASSIGDPGGIYSEKKKVHDKWKAYLNEFKNKETTPDSLKNVKFSGGF